MKFLLLTEGPEIFSKKDIVSDFCRIIASQVLKLGLYAMSYKPEVKLAIIQGFIQHLQQKEMSTSQEYDSCNHLFEVFGSAI